MEKPGRSWPITVLIYNDKPHNCLYQLRNVKYQEHDSKNDNCNGGLLFHSHDMWHVVRTFVHPTFEIDNTNKTTDHDDGDWCSVSYTGSYNVYFFREGCVVDCVSKLHVTERVSSLVYRVVESCTWENVFSGEADLNL